MSFRRSSGRAGLTLLLAVALGISGQRASAANPVSAPAKMPSLQDVLANPARIAELAAPQQQVTNPVRQPDVLARPIAIGTEQSAYRAADATGNTLVVTYTVANLRPPTIAPPTVPTSATVTDTLNALAGFDALADPNSIRGVLVRPCLHRA